MTNTSLRSARAPGIFRRYWPVLLVAQVIACLLAVGLWLMMRQGAAWAEGTEAQNVLDAQADLPFQVLIPSFLPAGFDRAGAEVKITQASAMGQPGLLISYHDREAGASVHLSEWLPLSATMETLVGSKPIETRWGRGYLLAAKRSGHSTIWADVDGLRVALDSSSSKPVTPEVALAILNSLGPAANQKVSTVMAQKPVIRQAALPPPTEATLNNEGIQELTLVATVAGYSPTRFSVRAGTPVRLTFRELGDAACAAELVFPADPSRPTELFLASAQDIKTLNFTPVQQGDFVFHCVHDIYKGVMTVRE